MLKRIMGLVVVGLLVFSAPAALPQAEQAQTVYTFVSQWQVPRANWAQYTEDAEKNARPVLERMMADGTLIGWGAFENLVHTPDGYTHGNWFTATSLAGITRALEELRKSASRPALAAATKHQDFLMRVVLHKASSVSESVGYLRVVGVVTMPGKSDEYVAAIKKYLQPTFEEQFKKGTLTYYGIDAQYVNTEAPSLRFVVTTYPNAEAMDKFAAAINSTLDKMSPDDRKGWEESIASTTVPNSRRDIMARITHYAHK